jgi:hypothetical protein
MAKLNLYRWKKSDWWFPFDVEPSRWWLASILGAIALWATPANPLLRGIIAIMAWTAFLVWLGVSVAWEHYKHRWPFVPDDIQEQWAAAKRLLPSPTKPQVEQWAQDTLQIVQKRWGLSSRNDLEFQECIAHPTGIPLLNLEILRTKLQSFGVPPL